MDARRPDPTAPLTPRPVRVALAHVYPHGDGRAMGYSAGELVRSAAVADAHAQRHGRRYARWARTVAAINATLT